MKELSNYVIENLGDVYPELEKSVAQVENFLSTFFILILKCYNKL